MRISITGGSGFIGRHVVSALAAAGHEVTVLDTAPRHHPAAAATREVDILDESRLGRAIVGSDVVFHLAGVSNVNEAQKDPAECVRVNVDGTANVCEAARHVGARVVLASTVWVYGAAVAVGDDALDEHASFDLAALDHVYTASKLAAEAVLQSYRRLYDLPITVLRYGIPYGPGMRPELVLARFVSQALAGEPITIAGDGEQTRNYLYVRDLAAAHVAALDDAAVGQVFALEGGRPVSVLEMAEIVLRLTRSGSRIQRVPARPGDYVTRPVSAERAARVLNWRASTAFEDGVQHYLDWLGTPELPTGRPTTRSPIAPAP